LAKANGNLKEFERWRKEFERWRNDTNYLYNRSCRRVFALRANCRRAACAPVNKFSF
jgi:hypothetical protein